MKPSDAKKREREEPLVRAGREMRRRDTAWRLTAPAAVMLIVGVLAVGGVLSVFAPKPTVSVYENRNLAKRPDFTLRGLVSGQYVKELETYYADTFPLREGFVRAAARIEDGYGLRMDDVRIHEAVDPAPPSSAAPAPPPGHPTPAPEATAGAPAGSGPADPPAAPAPEPSQAPAPEGERQGSVFMLGGQALGLFGSNPYASARYAQTLNDWQQTVGEGVTVYNLIVPTHIEFALPARYRDLSAPQKPNIESIYSQLDPAIRRVDAYAALEAHRDEYLYFGTDHHWTALGAYYAYTAFCQEAGLAPYPLEQMEKRTLENFVGTMYSQTQDPVLLEHPDHVDYWVIPTPHEVLQYRRGQPFTGYPMTLLGEYAKSPNSYSVFLHGDYPLTKITTNIQNGRKIAVVKESFGNAFAPFLVNNYQEVYVVDQRYFQLNLPAFMRENGINELLFLNNIFAANTDVRINEIARLRTQVYVPPTPAPEPTPEPEPEPTPEPEPSSKGQKKPWPTRKPRPDREEDDG